ncbi:MAG: cytochrome c [Gemmatimonadota bacterium]|nr:cytochrome c [Gemmatimonadota bacterium]
MRVRRWVQAKPRLLGHAVLILGVGGVGCAQEAGGPAPDQPRSGDEAGRVTHSVPGFGGEGPVVSTDAFPPHGPLEARSASGPVPLRFGFGRPASPANILAWDIDVGPDGAGLPEGSGTAAEGGAVYVVKCAHCHGLEGEGGVNDRLVTGNDGSGARAIGAYWPYATTLFDYVRRAMPYDRPGSLTDDEVYDLTAWLLYRNGLIAKDLTVDRDNLPDIAMPGLNLFVPDDREAYRQVR